MSWFSSQRNAVSVLPVPVGARMSVCEPLAIAGHPSRCGALGEPSVSVNHFRTMGWNGFSAEGARGAIPYSTLADYERRGERELERRSRREARLPPLTRLCDRRTSGRARRGADDRALRAVPNHLSENGACNRAADDFLLVRVR